MASGSNGLADCPQQLKDRKVVNGSYHVKSGEAGLLHPAAFGQEDAGESRQTSALCKWLTVEEGGITAHVDGIPELDTFLSNPRTLQ